MPLTHIERLVVLNNVAKSIIDLQRGLSKK